LKKAITVCDEWRDSPVKFYEWALANGYSDRLQLDRQQNHLRYKSRHCRWRTQLEQQNNN